MGGNLVCSVYCKQILYSLGCLTILDVYVLVLAGCSCRTSDQVGGGGLDYTYVVDILTLPIPSAKILPEFHPTGSGH